MVSYTKFVYLLFLVLSYNHVEAVKSVNSITIITTITGVISNLISFAKCTSVDIDDSTKYLDQDQEVDVGENYEYTFDSERNMSIDQLNYLSSKSDVLRINIESVKDAANDEIFENLVTRLSIIIDNSVIINKYFNKFLKYTSKPENYTKNEVIEFAKSIVLEESTVEYLLEEIHRILLLEDDTTKSTVDLIADHGDILQLDDKITKNPLQILEELLKYVTFTEIEGFLTIKYAYKILESYNDERNVGLIEKAKYDHHIRLRVTEIVFKNAISRVQHVEDPIPTTATISTVTGIITFANQLWNSIKTSKKYSMAHLNHLSISDQLRVDIENIKDEITDKITDSELELVELNRRLSIVYKNLLNISKSYDNFLQYAENPGRINSNILKEITFKTLGSYGIIYLLEETHNLLTNGDESAIRLLVKHMELFLESKKVFKSPQQILSNILKSVIYTEIKSYLMMRYNYRLLTVNDGGHYIEKMEYDFGRRINETITAFKTVMSFASTEIWKDDPQQHIDGVTFTELKHVFQLYVANEYDISKDDNCAYTCSKYNTDQKATDDCYYKDICAHQRVCEGYLYRCTNKLDFMEICPSDKNDTRRYEYIENKINGSRYGLKEEICSTDLISVNSQSAMLGIRTCQPCTCICADTTAKSERYFNLDPSMARFVDNYVITGVRFVKRNNIVHIQIQEGQLLPDGNVNQSTVAWVPLNDKPKNVHTLVYDKSRGINLDDLQAPENHVLIGLSFNSKNFRGRNNKVYKRIHLKIFSTPLNFTSGKLFTNSSYHKEVISISSTDRVDLSNLDIPTRNAVRSSSTKSKPTQYLKFATSGFNHDVGQSTIPFIDLQNITTYPATPMSGAGIYHRRKVGDGGFLALKLFTYNVTHHFDANLAQNLDL